MPPLKRARLPLVLLAGISLLAALWAGLSRLGWDVPLPSFSLPSFHGPLMVAGFVSTLVGLERASVLRRTWAYGAPLFSGLAAVALVFGVPAPAAQVLLVAGAVLLTAIFALLCRQHRSLPLATMGAGALLLAAGSALWRQDEPLYHGSVIPCWVGFLVLSIAAERLELSRVTGTGAWKEGSFVAASGVLFGGVLLSLFHREPGLRVIGVGLAGIALWLLMNDLVWRTVRMSGLPRYIAASLIAGYGWLAAAGVLWVVYAGRFLPGPEYDAMLHSIFLGFVFSMILGHAPIILPAVLGIPLPFSTRFYGPLLLLHASLLLRIGGELAGWIPAQRWGGLVNVVAVLIFAANSLRAARS